MDTRITFLRCELHFSCVLCLFTRMHRVAKCAKQLVLQHVL